jgi:hypothetical protein
MSKMTRRVTRLGIAALLAAAAFAGSVPSARAQNAPAPPVPRAPSQDAPVAPRGQKSLAEMLRETKFPFTEVKEGVYRVAVEVSGEVSMITIEQRTLNWKSRDGSPNLIASMYVQITPSLPKDFRVPPAMLMRMAELNDTLLFGGLSINGKEQKAVFYNSSLHLRTADSESLNEYLILAHSARLVAKKELTPFLQEASGN